MNLQEQLASAIASAKSALETGDLDKGREYRQQAENVKAAMDELETLEGLKPQPMRPILPGTENNTGTKSSPAQPKSKPERFGTFGEFLLAVARDAQGTNRDNRLSAVKSNDPVEELGFDVGKAMGDDFVGSLYDRNKGFPYKVGESPQGLGEQIDSEGGFLVGTQQAAGIMAKVYNVGQLIQRVDMVPVSGNNNGMTFNAEDETNRANGSRRGGIQAYWATEAGTVTATNPKFRQLELKLKKVMGLVYATEDLLADATALEAWIMTNLPEELRFKVEDAIMNGDGSGKPLGILAGPALVSQAAETGQASTTVVAENIMKMYSRMYVPSVGRAVWLINQNVWPQLWSMGLVVGTGGVALFQPPGGMSGQPYGTLMGRPIIPTEYQPGLGTVGDILFVDLQEYQMIEKGTYRSSASMHVRFLYDEQVFKFVYRVDGAPKWNSALTPFKGTGSTVSPYVALASR